jgi:hypothetical protein
MDPMALFGGGAPPAGRARGHMRKKNADAHKKNKRKAAKKSRRKGRR